MVVLLPMCFISYAWEDKREDGGRANSAFQQWLSCLTSDLKKLGVTVFLDINAMRENIAKSDYVIIIGTKKRWKLEFPPNFALHNWKTWRITVSS